LLERTPRSRTRRNSWGWSNGRTRSWRS